MNNQQDLTTRVDFESRLSSKLKASFKTRPQESSEKYYHLLITPYMGSEYIQHKKQQI